MIALAIGVVYTAIGLIGFAVTGFDDFASETGETLIGFEINPLHNIVHLVIGIAGLAMWRTIAIAKAYGWALVVAYGATFVYGLFAVDDEDLNILSLNEADNWLHLGTALVALVAALWPVEAPAGTRGRRSTM